MNQIQIIKKTTLFIQNRFKNDSSGHDFFHLQRVVNLAKHIQKQEGGDTFLIEMAAWLHDVNDYKLVDDIEKATQELLDFLKELDIPKTKVDAILKIISEISFSGGFTKKPTSLEALIVQDADRLDAIGAIGIARTFAYGGNKKRLIYHPDILPQKFKNASEYKSSDAPTLNHFQEKLFLLKDLINTDSAKIIANKRHQIMENYVAEFLEEWNFSI